MPTAIEKRRFETPDEVLDMKSAGSIAIMKMQHGTTGMRAVFEPGWTWEKDERPLLGNPETCPMHHTGYSLSGELVVRVKEFWALRRASVQVTFSRFRPDMTDMSLGTNA